MASRRAGRDEDGGFSREVLRSAEGRRQGRLRHAPTRVLRDEGIGRTRAKKAFAGRGGGARSSGVMSDSDPAADEPRDPYAALRVPAYRRYLIGNTLANIGRQALGLVTTWKIYR